MTVVLAVAAAGCGTGDGGPGSTSERVQSSAASGVGEEDWAALGLPYGELDREADPPVWRLAYRDHMVEVPFATDNGESTPITQLLSMTATKNAAVFELAPPEGAPRLWMLTAQGEWSQIAEDVHGIPLANVNGTEVYWNVAVEGKDETALVGFDTADGSKFLDVTVADQPYVSAMDAGVAFLSPTSLEQPARMVDAAGEDVLSSSRAGVNVDELVTAYREGVGAMVRSGEAVSRLALPDGSTAFELDGDFYGQFNSVGTYVALSDPVHYRVLSVPSGKEVALEGLPADDFHLASLQWTTGDQLVIEGTAESLEEPPVEGEHVADLLPVPFRCSIPDGECVRIADRVLGAYGESSARGQAYANLPADYEDEGE